MKEEKFTKEEIEIIHELIGMVIADQISRKLMGVGVIDGYKKMYGEKWRKEGIEFSDMANQLQEELNEINENIK